MRIESDDADRRFVEEIRTSLDESVSRIDSETLFKLRRARVRAMEQGERGKRTFFAFPRWVTAGGFATAAVVAVAASCWFLASPGEAPLHHPVDVEILTAQDHLDLYGDLEFYRWLAADTGAVSEQ